MKDYPSIPKSFREFDAYIFDKLDGSNLRWEWSKKRGWYKSGSRAGLIGKDHPILGRSVDLFMAKYSEGIAKVAKDNRWESVVAFTEFYGPHSLGGWHDEKDTMDVTLFDVAPYKQGFLGPAKFIKLFEHLGIPKFLGQQRWTRGFVTRVRQGEVDGVTFEGVVGKAGDGKSHDLVMAKAKTQAWIDAILARYGTEEGTKIVES